MTAVGRTEISDRTSHVKFIDERMTQHWRSGFWHWMNMAQKAPEMYRLQVRSQAFALPKETVEMPPVASHSGAESFMSGSRLLLLTF